MAEVNLQINNRTYRIACDDGQEKRVLELGRYVDERLRDIARAGAASNEAHLLVLTSIVLADEVFDLLENEDGSQTEGKSISGSDEAEFAGLLEKLATRIDSIAGSLQKN